VSSATSFSASLPSRVCIPDNWEDEGFPLRQPAVAACWGGRCILFLGTLLVQVIVPAPQAAGRLLAVCPDVAELLAVMALRKTILSFIGLCPDCDVAELGSLNIS
jgi:hypothetical protein